MIFIYYTTVWYIVNA